VHDKKKRKLSGLEINLLIAHARLAATTYWPRTGD